MTRTKQPKPVLTTWEHSAKFPPAPNRPQELNHFGLSGGKDSTALAIWAIHESGYPRDTLDFTFCDTGNESPITYDYLKYLEDALQVGITTIHPHLKFFELAKKKKRFPSAKARFCTMELKIRPTLDYINAMFRTGHKLLLHSGVRGAESDSRAKLLDREYDGRFLCEVRRPILKWSLSDVWAIHDRYGIKPNPLYRLGMKRVGCFPCVMNRKAEVRVIARLFPQVIQQLASRELDTTRDTGFQSFFEPKKTPERFWTRSYVRKKDGATLMAPTILDVVRWAQTSRGGHTYDLIEAMAEMGLKPDELPTTEDDKGMCPSTFGHCE